MRTPLIAGNWKLNKTLAETSAFFGELSPLIQDAKGVDIAIFSALYGFDRSARNRAVKRGNRRARPLLEKFGRLHWRGFGAFVG